MFQNRKLKPEVRAGYSSLDGGVYVCTSNLDIGIVNTELYGPEDVIKRVDVVASQTWLTRYESGFNLGTTDLFTELNDRKILEYYRDKAFPTYSRQSHVNRIARKYNDYLVLSLASDHQAQPAHD